VSEITLPETINSIKCDGIGKGGSNVTIYYEGSEEQFQNIDKDTTNNNWDNVTVVYGKSYEKYAQNILDNSSQDEINDMFYEGVCYWCRGEADYDPDVWTKQYVAERYGYSSYDELLENIWKEYGHDSLEELLIEWRGVKPEGYYGE
jgi:hypothetical protein